MATAVSADLFFHLYLAHMAVVMRIIINNSNHNIVAVLGVTGAPMAFVQNDLRRPIGCARTKAWGTSNNRVSQAIAAASSTQFRCHHHHYLRSNSQMASLSLAEHVTIVRGAVSEP